MGGNYFLVWHEVESCVPNFGMVELNTKNLNMTKLLVASLPHVWVIRKFGGLVSKRKKMRLANNRQVFTLATWGFPSLPILTSRNTALEWGLWPPTKEKHGFMGSAQNLRSSHMNVVWTSIISTCCFNVCQSTGVFIHTQQGTQHELWWFQHDISSICNL